MTRALPWSAPIGAKVRLVVAAVGIGLLAAVNFYLAGRSISLVFGGAEAIDWGQYVEASRRVHGGDLYAITDSYAYRYSPLLAVAFGLMAPIGVTIWRALHLVAVLALPSWPMRVVALAAWPLWYDIQTGNVLAFIVLTAAWAIRGSRLATAGFLLLVLLIPRPLMFPVAVWLLWQRPEWRLPFVAACLAHAIAVVFTGWGDEWLGTLIAAGGDAGLPSNVGPSRFLGTVPWMLLGIPLAAWFTWKGRLGIASLAASPYWLPYYLLMLLLELRHPLRLHVPGRPGTAEVAKL